MNRPDLVARSDQLLARIDEMRGDRSTAWLTGYASVIAPDELEALRDAIDAGLAKS